MRSSPLGSLIGLARSVRLAGRALSGLEPFVDSRLVGSLPGGGREASVRIIAREGIAGGLEFLFDPSRPLEHHVHWRGSFLGLPRRGGRPCGNQDDIVLRERILGASRPGPQERGPLFTPYLLGSLPVAVDCEAQLRAVPSRGTRGALRRATRHVLTRRLTRDQGDVERFHRSGFRPFVERRFGRAALVVSQEEMQARIEKGGALLLLEAGGIPIAGALLYVARSSPTALYWWKTALFDTQTPVPIADRAAALELQVLAHARERGFRRLDIGLAHNLASNGVFVHKRRLGCDFLPLSGAPRFRMTLRPESRVAVLSRLPLFVQTASGLEFWIGHGSLASDQRSLRERLVDARFPSLAAARVFSATAIDPSALQEARGSGLPVEPVIG